ncbi:response regulator [Dyadobacter sp. CY356]|uniref:response regulator n=1 Tax=Dyadobacter sp. CY356 TaxID=2906442 RepID=UPI001F487B96|nr:response regulator [Dyadobacter sp. CY356]MCF0055176.1 response regulator [Dyadobacter sp. CY356]
MKNRAFLLIDDDQDDHIIFADALSIADPDATCDYAFNCPDAIDFLNKQVINIPDYIFMDWNMPYMEAIDSIQALRKIPGIDNTPIYILSGSKPSFEIQDKVGLMIQKVLTKQNSIEQLAAEIQEAIG